ncbi:hypothetical protein [Endozoicomonas lisbonensis]|uniref:CNP1-like uncharacterized domain-containing protein n=1 Tax=Endozoicomonas lisbonensis TaxID=3120522 RepID=A0ABV2SG38_9GAMM
MNKLTLLLFAFLTALPAWGAAVLKPEGKPTSFVRLMKDDSGERVSGQELQAYLNSLLRANAIYDRTASDEQPSLYFSVKANQAGDLVVTRKLTQANRIVMENNTLKVYGMGYSLQSDCSRLEQRCWVLFPNRKTRWMEITYAPKAVKELATGIGLLIKEMQR